MNLDTFRPAIGVLLLFHFEPIIASMYYKTRHNVGKTSVDLGNPIDVSYHPYAALCSSSCTKKLRDVRKSVTKYDSRSGKCECFRRQKRLEFYEDTERRADVPFSFHREYIS